MTENGYIQEVQAVRALVADYESRTEWHREYAIAKSDSYRKFRAMLATLFVEKGTKSVRQSVRNSRLLVLSTLLGQPLTTCIAQPQNGVFSGMTNGEVMALVNWLDSGADYVVNTKAGLTMVWLKREINRRKVTDALGPLAARRPPNEVWKYDLTQKAFPI